MWRREDCNWVAGCIYKLSSTNHLLKFLQLHADFLCVIPCYPQSWISECWLWFTFDQNLCHHPILVSDALTPPPVCRADQGSVIMGLRVHARVESKACFGYSTLFQDWQLLRGQPRADDVQQGESHGCQLAYRTPRKGTKRQ